MVRARIPWALTALACALSLPLSPALGASSDAFSAPLDPLRWETSTPSRGAAVLCPAADPGARDGQSLRLTYPGPSNPRRSGPGWSTLVQTRDRATFGAYSARMKAAPAQGRAGIISAFFTYFNDGSDSDGDGIADNSEIDFELLAAEPSMVYITVFTEYEVQDGFERFYHTATKVNVATGEVWRTEPGFEDAWGHLVPAAPLGWSVPGFDASAAYHTYGFDWRPESVTFWMDVDGERRTLWHLEGEADVSIPSVPAHLMFNLWHNDRAWDSNAPAPPPRAPADFWIDDVRFEAELGGVRGD